jgi:8-oxo-dGTP pyrophosphatase MutT (NUDIX family)
MEDNEKHFVGLVTQKALIQKEGKILVHKYPPGGPTGGRYDFPGGRLNVGEDITEGLRREVFEEIGAEITIDGIVKTGTIFNVLGEPTFFVMYKASLVTPEANFVFQADEVAEVHFVSSDEFFALPMVYPKYQEALKSFLK